MENTTSQTEEIVENVTGEHLLQSSLQDNHPTILLLKTVRRFRDRAIARVLGETNIDSETSLDALHFESENPDLPSGVIEQWRKIRRIFLLLRHEEVRQILGFCSRWEEGIHEKIRAASL